MVVQKEQLEARAKAFEKEGSEDEPGSPKHSKSARAYAKTYKPGPPLVPALIVERILTYITKVIIRKKVDFLHMMCRYWSLKREARRGAPLLKRLHLEPWTAFNNAKTYSEEEKSKKLEVRIHRHYLLHSFDIYAVVPPKTPRRSWKSSGFVRVDTETRNSQIEADRRHPRDHFSIFLPARAATAVSL